MLVTPDIQDPANAGELNGDSGTPVCRQAGIPACPDPSGLNVMKRGKMRNSGKVKKWKGEKVER